MAERRLYVMNEREDLRTLLMHEPRGHSAMSGAILQPPTRPDADIGVVFIEVSGCLPMCGHGTMGTATVLVETGMVPVKEPVTVIRIDTPAGLVEASVEVEGGHARSVTIRNVPAYLHLRDATVRVSGFGEVVVDVAWGGNFYAVLPAASLGWRCGHRSTTSSSGRASLSWAPSTSSSASLTPSSLPSTPATMSCSLSRATRPSRDVLRSPSTRVGSTARPAAPARAPGWRSCTPAASCASARTMCTLLSSGPVSPAALSARLLSAASRPWCLPCAGRAWVTGLASYLLDPDDPFPAGFLLGRGA